MTSTGAIPDRVGPYTVERELGRGGMGVVYLASDTRLGRRVALKSLPADVGTDPSRLARLEREARALASLSHPNVAGIYGIEESGGARFLVLELVEGETLGERLRRGPLPVDEAIAVCEQVAAGVEAAHESGVIHRDLKPDNVQLTADGKVKVLDFGLAKDADGTKGSGFAGAATVPASPGTIPGVVMGTPGYMSPEQARGKSIDKRTDIWALGCVLFECLAGKRAFDGETATDSIAAVLEREPQWGLLPEKTPRRVRELLKRCLEKDARNRLRDMGDARIELGAALAGREWTTGAMQAAGGGAGARRFVVPALAVLLVGAALVGGWALGRGRTTGAGPGPATTLPTLHVSMMVPRIAKSWPVHAAMSPDGSEFAYVAEEERHAAAPGLGHTQVLLRKMDEYEARVVPGTVGARTVSFSPDGKWIVFNTLAEASTHRHVFWKLALAGGPAVKLCEVAGEYLPPASWASDGAVLVVGDFATTVSRVSGAKTEVVFKMTDRRDVTVRSVEALPGGGGAVITLSMGHSSDYHVSAVAVNLKDLTEHVVLEDAGYAKFMPGPAGSGHLIFSRGDAMLAAPFNPEKLEVTGGIVPVLSGVRSAPEAGAPGFGFATKAGVLWYEPGGLIGGKRRLVQMDRKGVKTPLSEATGLFVGTSNISSDGRHVAVESFGSNNALEIVVIDVAGGAVHRLDVPGSDVYAPAWSPDGKRLYFTASSQGKPQRIMSCGADLSDEPVLLREAPDVKQMLGPIAFNHDGSVLTCYRFSTESGTDVVAVSMSGEHVITPLVATQARERNGRISPDGRFMVYDADVSGQLEIYLAPINTEALGPVHGVQISVGGGESPMWSLKGDEVFYFSSDFGLMSVKLTGSGLATGAPVSLVGPEIIETLDGGDVMPDGEHFVFIEQGKDEGPPTHLNIVQNWTGALGQPASGGR